MVNKDVMSYHIVHSLTRCNTIRTTLKSKHIKRLTFFDSLDMFVYVSVNDKLTRYQSVSSYKQFHNHIFPLSVLQRFFSAELIPSNLQSTTC